MTKTKTTTRTTKATAARVEERHTDRWLDPISDAAPCGPNLEYDNEYAVLLARMAPQVDAQYGEYITKPEAPDWNEIERQCRRLLLRSRDLSVLIWLARCRTRLGGAAGMHEAMEMLASVVERYPEEIHPQLVIDGERDPAVRANALAAMCDPEGLLSDIREVAVSSNTASRLLVRDVERAFAVPRPSDALPLDAVRQQLEDLRAQGNLDVLALGNACGLLRTIDRWGRDSLGDDAPDLHIALRLLGLFEAKSTEEPNAMVTPPSETVAETQTVETPATTSPHADQAPFDPSPLSSRPQPDSTHCSLSGTHLNQREQVRATLRMAKEWLEQYEPSSPVVILLKQAERLLGKRFAEVAQAIPPDLLARWDAE